MNTRVSAIACPSSDCPKRRQGRPELKKTFRQNDQDRNSWAGGIERSVSERFSRQDAARRFQFDQQPEAGARALSRALVLNVSLWHCRTSTGAGPAIDAPHVVPVVFALGATQPTQLVITAVSAAQRPEKLVGTRARHKGQSSNILWGPGRLPEVPIM